MLKVIKEEERKGAEGREGKKGEVNGDDVAEVAERKREKGVRGEGKFEFFLYFWNFGILKFNFPCTKH